MQQLSQQIEAEKAHQLKERRKVASLFDHISSDHHDAVRPNSNSSHTEKDDQAVKTVKNGAGFQFGFSGCDPSRAREK
jgi:hypothetical protein